MTRVDPREGDRQVGFADVKLSLIRPLSHEVLLNLGLTVPSRGDVGSAAYNQFAKATYSQKLGGPWTTVGILGATHYNDPKPGIGRTKGLLYGELDYEIDDSHTVNLNLALTKRAGAAWVNELGAEYDFPLGKKGPDAAFVVTHGLTKSAKHTGIELDITFKFEGL
jgi:hypothetical protein